MKLTDRTLKALKPKAERYEKWDEGRAGFGVRVSPAGRKSFIFMYRFEGRPRRMTLGTYPAMSLATARTKHAQAQEAVEKGIDPGAVHVETRRAERQAETVADLIEEYLSKWARPNKRSAAEDERILRKDVLPQWGKKKAKDIRRRDVILLLDDIVERGAPIGANRTLGVIRRMFNFAVSRDILDATPVAMVKAPAKEHQRDRVLTAAEIKMLWKGLDRTVISPIVTAALKLQLVTAQRKGEIIGAALSEFDLENEIWTIPAERSKNGIAHEVPLSPLALDLIRHTLQIAQENAERRAKRHNIPPRDPKWLFPSPRGDGPVKPQAINGALYRACMAPEDRPETGNLGGRPAIGLTDVVPHDLRRTAASGMTALGIPRLVVSKVLNHVERGVTAIYDRHTYDAEKRHALEAWAAHLETILTGKPKADNVVPLAKAAETA